MEKIFLNPSNNCCELSPANLITFARAETDVLQGVRHRVFLLLTRAATYAVVLCGTVVLWCCGSVVHLPSVQAGTADGGPYSLPAHSPPPPPPAQLVRRHRQWRTTVRHRAVRNSQ